MRSAVIEYTNAMQRAANLLRPSELEGAVGLLSQARREGRGIYICGNGGSASTASHLAVDLGKIIGDAGGPRLRVLSLTDNAAWLTALSNDCGYENCFRDQLRNFVQPGDLVIGISASGDSENVVRAFELARDVHASRMALIGFDGGRLAKLSTRRVWIHSHDYGIVESMHLFVCHLIVNMLAESGVERSLPSELTRLDGQEPASKLPALINRSAVVAAIDE